MANYKEGKTSLVSNVNGTGWFFLPTIEWNGHRLQVWK